MIYKTEDGREWEFDYEYMPYEPATRWQPAEGGFVEIYAVREFSNHAHGPVKVLDIDKWQRLYGITDDDLKNIEEEIYTMHAEDDYID
jgi:hypothetical protein